MSSPKDTPFTKPNSESQYGKTPLESWVGTVVSYDKQKEQIEAGWGWRYKVRIMGDNTNSDQITDEQLSYAYVLLPTTAGSGGAFKMRSVRISQGDFVYGVRGGGAGAPTMILGVFPRTKNQKEGTGNFKNSTGFYGSLNSDSEILDGEFNEQTGPATPGTDPVGPKNYNKAEQREPSDKSEQLGVTAVGDEDVDVEKKLTPKKTIQSSQEYNEKVQKGEIAVKNEETLDNITEGALNGDIDPTVAIVATNSAVEENIIEESVGNDIKKNLEEKKSEFKGEKMVEVKNPKGETILLKESVVEAGFSFASENKDDEDDDVTFERVVDNKGNITFKSSSKETVTGSSSVSITYDEETNTFTSESVTTSSQTISGLVVGSEAPKNDTDIKLRLIQNQKRLNYFIDLYSRPTYTGNREEKIAEAKNYIKQLENFENNPGDYDGSSLQATLKSKYYVNY
jgi:hypothetical protein